MRIPKSPPNLQTILSEMPPERIKELFAAMPQIRTDDGRYLHWDKLRHYQPPDSLSHREWWLLLKLSRQEALRPIPLLDSAGKAFSFSVPDSVMEALHQIDLGAGGLISLPEPITNSQTRDRYLVSSLIEEAITSSQLEGAVTTRDVAAEMIRTGRKPRDISEQMILNNYNTMKYIRELKSAPLTPQLVFQVHNMVTIQTLDDPTAAGRFRRADEQRVVAEDYGNVYHTPPPSEELQQRMDAMCEFANGKSPDYFIHPAVRAVILHFWLAYDHPFVDGNGRTARALFYWAMLNHGYWLFEFISISSILKKAPAKYGRSFLNTETDDNDLTYFLVSQTEVINRAIGELHQYVDRKTNELREVESRMRALNMFNHRQAEILKHALKHPRQQYTFESHRKSHNVAYQTARTDLLALVEHGLLLQQKRGKKIVLIPPADLVDRLHRLDSGGFN